MSNAPNAPASGKPVEPPPQKQAIIHRVCTQCNNMFRVPADKFDAKQCPNCHKG